MTSALAGALVAAPAHAAPTLASELSVALTGGGGYEPGGKLTFSGKLTDKVSGAGLAEQAVKVTYCFFSTVPKKDVCEDFPVKTGTGGVYEVKVGYGIHPQLEAEKRSVTAAFAANETHTASTATQAFKLAPKSRFIDLDAPYRVKKGNPVKVTGALELYNETRIVPWDGAEVRLLTSTDRQNWTAADKGKTDANGKFLLIGTADKTAFWKVEPVGYADNTSRALRVRVAGPQYKAEIAELHKPGQVASGTSRTIHLKSVLVDQNGNRKANQHARVNLQFKPKWANDWRDVSSGETDWDGRITFNPVFKEDGYWRVVLPGRRLIKPIEDSFFVDTKIGTRIWVNAGPEPVKKGRTLTVKGGLKNVDWSPVNGARVSIYFKAKGTGEWKWAGWAWTDASGAFFKQFKAKKDGSWKVKFWGDPENYSSGSGWDYVDVR